MTTVRTNYTTTRSARRRALAAVVALAAVGAACSSTDQAETDTSTGDNTEITKTVETANGLVLGTTAGPPDAADPTSGGRLVFGIEAEPEGLDPTRYAFSSSGHIVASAVYDPLATLDENGDAVPYLAESIEPNNDFTSWTITIPSGITFHDGTALTAEVVAQNLRNYQASFVTGASLEPVTAIEATDDTHVQVDLSIPFVSFPALLATQIGYVIAPVMFDNPDMVNQPVGTGPFRFVAHENGQFWQFTRNEDYWREGLPYLDALSIEPVPDNGNRLEGLEAGTFDIINIRSPEEMVELRDSDYKRVENAGGEEDYLVLNTDAPPFNNLAARQAVAYAIDTDKYRDELNRGVPLPADGPFAEGQPGYLEDNGYPAYDPEKAREFATQYETETGQPLSFTLVTQDDPDVLEESQLLTEMFNAAGMELTVEALPQINLVAQIATGNYTMGRFRLFNSPSVDPDASFWRSTSVLDPPAVSLNFPRFADDQVDEAILTALATEDFATKDEAYQTVNRAFAENLPYIWLDRAVWMLAANDHVNGIYAAANGSLQTIGPKTWLASLWKQV